MNNLKKIITLLYILFFTLPVFSADTQVLLKTTKTWDNAIYKKLCIKHPEVTVLNIKIGIGESLDMHKHDITNVAYVKQGILTVITEDGKEITVSKGQCLPEIVGKYHYGKNSGQEPVELIVFYVGEKNSPLSVKKR